MKNIIFWKFRWFFQEIRKNGASGLVSSKYPEGSPDWAKIGFTMVGNPGIDTTTLYCMAAWAQNWYICHLRLGRGVSEPLQWHVVTWPSPDSLYPPPWWGRGVRHWGAPSLVFPYFALPAYNCFKIKNKNDKADCKYIQVQIHMTVVHLKNRNSTRQLSG